jgi:uncharacterized membrane protein (UPF0127 family)
VVEVARTELERRRGLKFLPYLSPGFGMLFIFDAPAPIKFWMQHTFAPLDIIFIDAAGSVLHVEEHAAPLSLGLLGPDEASQFVVEVPAGWARTHSIEIGNRAHFLS